ncbi:MAG: hypothetical protein JST00_44910 [Deltaproteobacteria bacterium]|nr:hypothetical protein [Deltaproteobacteria bacterium]
MKGRVFVFGSIVGGLAAACGPSFQAIYEGNARFEHCYALEENSQIPMTDKADCWRDWSERYTYGQTRDRIHYATARYVALSQVPNIPTDEAMMMAAPGVAPRQTAITAPAPTNAFAPPPKVLDEGAPLPPPRPNERRTIVGRELDGGPAEPSGPKANVDAGAPVRPLPASACGSTCASRFEACGDAGTCEKTYKTCMRGCFK